ncbi:MAG: hypothetical protein FWD82_07390 [Defluviitaleaceae bacterium]|nr:hypothetical protein [Defluviitaleaceae bacterium]
MWIIIRSEEHKFKLWLPIGVLSNRIVARKLFSYTRKNNDSFDDVNLKDFQRFIRKLGKLKRQYKGLEIVNIESKDGDIVIIKL